MGRLCHFSLPVFVLIATVGCQGGNSPRPKNDPFIPQRASTDDSKNNPFFGSGKSVSRDTARHVSTSPATDPLYGSLPKIDEPRRHDAIANNRFSERRIAVGERKTPNRDPFLRQNGDDRDSRANRFVGDSSPDEPKQNVIAQNDYQSIRRRLDRLGVRILWFGPEKGTDEVLFQGAIHHPNNPNRLRVFEARDRDGRRAMQAVTEAIEKWLENDRQ